MSRRRLLLHCPVSAGLGTQTTLGHRANIFMSSVKSCCATAVRLLRTACPLQVAAFLSPMHPAWDLSLAFVMGGALLVALPGGLGTHRQTSVPCKHAAQLLLPAAATLSCAGLR